MDEGADALRQRLWRYITGLFSKKKKEETALDKLTPKIKNKFDELAERCNQLEEEGQYGKAIGIWEEVLDLIPEPQQLFKNSCGTYRMKIKMIPMLVF